MLLIINSITYKLIQFLLINLVEIVTSEILVFYYLYMVAVGLFILSMILNFVPVVVIYGARILEVFIITLFMWGPSVIRRWRLLNIYTTINIRIMTLILSIDYFIMVLRPLTLSLRIIINISLGHVIVESVIGRGSIIIIMYVFERFVYLIQSYVFFMLVKSYVIK